MLCEHRCADPGLFRCSKSTLRPRSRRLFVDPFRGPQKRDRANEPNPSAQEGCHRANEPTGLLRVEQTARTNPRRSCGQNRANEPTSDIAGSARTNPTSRYRRRTIQSRLELGKRDERTQAHQNRLTEKWRNEANVKIGRLCGLCRIVASDRRLPPHESGASSDAPAKTVVIRVRAAGPVGSESCWPGFRLRSRTIPVDCRRTRRGGVPRDPAWSAGTLRGLPTRRYNSFNADATDARSGRRPCDPIRDDWCEGGDP